jgi:AhpD family alkylhydroperoxidase
MSEAERFFEEFPVRMRRVVREAPEVPQAFGELFDSVMKEGALSVREKELIALGIGMAIRCLPCIDRHVEKAVAAGASRKQILEAAAVAVMMQGGPTYTYMPNVVEALDAVEARNEPVEKQDYAHADT